MDLFTYVRNIEAEMKNIIETKSKGFIEQSPIKHNHPPMRGIVPCCLYCKKFGNVLENGAANIEDTDLKYKLYSFTHN